MKCGVVFKKIEYLLNDVCIMRKIVWKMETTKCVYVRNTRRETEVDYECKSINLDFLNVFVSGGV